MDSDDRKITQLTVAIPARTDVIPFVSSPSVTPQTKKSLVSSIGGGRPGGRLTLSSGVPVTITDVPSTATLYYTPYISDEIILWDSSVSAWGKIVFEEKSLAVGTVTSGLPYDVFGYLSSGDLVLEKLAWSSASARATAITIQDGRYCKSGDKTRLYLGTFMPDSTATVKDGLSYRGVYNMYNRVKRVIEITEATTHTNTNTATAYWNSSSDNKVEFILGLLEESVIYSYSIQMTCAGTSAPGKGCAGVGVNSTSVIDSIVYWASAFNARSFGARALYTTLGYNYLACLERGLTGVTFQRIQLSAEIMA